MATKKLILPFKILEYSEAEILSKSIFSLIHPEDHEATANELHLLSQINHPCFLKLLHK
jgi:hypothetical protein